ncbi:sugar ABC transporter substrate-binding protein [Rhizobium laguerreae]|uniref:Carbohydrate ABC transporter substrate-binding protein (CUT1 family) n=1 Tax=Rhizobium laguerreae TaxID=1076926 RepID=A0A1S9GZJ3_9HYPH|nr:MULTISPECIES: sugar ABC transporter substrate-binding protein [Rhizobium]MBB3164142.1 multiple sugar transport system substrate-binding protein [Rhizobium laguerreae]MBY3073145.1 sugar ABC transporter substrate-binding protein [Rhizobium laguerreae]MBY3087144.1 sugar ABC transporter substrate-binding protein [Rhizobium laguerreae]MBY3092077.1 sugar ABC transporter substrate-binding protein [Rhizobium laguerreae]MBY3099354.1 sugar ABC transporter substrate-binding protein [Rhizobium laguerre
MNIRKFGVTMRAAVAVWALCATSAFADTTIEFIQWWEPEMPSGALRGIMNDFEAKNPGIKVTLVSGPYATTRDQIVVGAASGTLSDVVGLDGAWVNGLSKQGAIASMDELMEQAKYDKSQITDIVKIDGKSVMFPLASFVYPVFVNLDIAKAAGVDKLPATRTEFAEAAKKMTDASKNQYGWVLPLSLQSPSGIQNDVMSWVWASGASMLKDGKPDLENEAVVGTLDYIASLNKEGVISPGIFAKKEQDKVEEFVNGRVGMMVDSLAHVNLIRERNPKLNFGISALPAIDGYTGKRGMPYASWGIGISEGSQHKEEAWKLVEYLMSPDVNGRLVSIANAFPGNVHAKPDFVASDPIFSEAFKIFQSGYPANEFVGLPVAEELMRDMNVEVQKMFDGGQSAKEAAANTEKAWLAKF